MTLASNRRSTSTIKTLTARCRALTVVELLIAITVLAVLLALAFPQFSRLLEQTKSTRCLAKQRQIGTLLIGFAFDNNGKIKLFRDGSEAGEKRWYNQLKTYANLSTAEAQAAFGCPSFPASSVGDWFCYGFRIGGSPGAIMRDTETAPRLYNLDLKLVEGPAKFFILGDSLTASTGKQTFRIVPPGLYSDGGIHLRHLGRANLLFLDGHVESLNAGGLKNAGFTETLDEEGNKVSTHPPN